VTASDLIQRALDARERAYAPYSSYAVGAALLCKGGGIYTGCNVENASYPVTCCAERVALFSAVAAGEREFTAIAVVGGKAGEQAPLSGLARPCGMCRQALSEFGADMIVYVARSLEDYEEYILSELLPYGFEL
jgi:homotetrameric cytidine deaminase